MKPLLFLQANSPHTEKWRDACRLSGYELRTFDLLQEATSEFVPSGAPHAIFVDNNCEPYREGWDPDTPHEVPPFEAPSGRQTRSRWISQLSYAQIGMTRLYPRGYPANQRHLATEVSRVVGLPASNPTLAMFDLVIGGNAPDVDGATRHTINMRATHLPLTGLSFPEHAEVRGEVLRDWTYMASGLPVVISREYAAIWPAGWLHSAMGPFHDVVAGYLVQAVAYACDDMCGFGGAPVWRESYPQSIYEQLDAESDYYEDVVEFCAILSRWRQAAKDTAAHVGNKDRVGALQDLCIFGQARSTVDSRVYTAFAVAWAWSKEACSITQAGSPAGSSET